MDAGRSWTSIADKTPDNGSFIWKAPGHTSKTCKIRVGHAESPTFAGSPSQAGRGYHWVRMTAQLRLRDRAGAPAYDGRMWLIGGWNWDDKAHFPRICSNDVWSSEDGVTWTLIKPNTFVDQTFDSNKDWEGRHTAGYAVFDGKMWILGGDANQKHYQNDVWN